MKLFAIALCLFSLTAFAGSRRPNGEIATEGQNCSSSRPSEIQRVMTAVSNRAPENVDLKAVVQALSKQSEAGKRKVLAGYFGFSTEMDLDAIERAVVVKIGKLATESELDALLNALTGSRN